MYVGTPTGARGLGFPLEFELEAVLSHPDEGAGN